MERRPPPPPERSKEAAHPIVDDPNLLMTIVALYAFWYVVSTMLAPTCTC